MSLGQIGLSNIYCYTNSYTVLQWLILNFFLFSLIFLNFLHISFYFVFPFFSLQLQKILQSGNPGTDHFYAAQSHFHAAEVALIGHRILEIEIVEKSVGEKPQTSGEQCEDEERSESIVDELSQASSEEYVMETEESESSSVETRYKMRPSITINICFVIYLLI